MGKKTKKKKRKKMDIVLTQGFDHIGVQLFDLLDDASLDKARQVCTAWKHFIETHKFYWKRSIIRVHRQKLVKSKQWTRIAESVVRKNKFQDMKSLAKVLRNFEVFHKGVSDQTILWKPDQDPLTVAVLKGHLEDMEYLWPLVRNKTRSYEDQNSMFHLAASKGHANLAKFFHGKFFHKPELLVNASHDTPLHVSVKSNHYDFTKALLEVLKENSPKNKRNETPLHLAVIHQRYEIVQLLLSFVKDKSPKDITERIPIHYAAMKGDLPMLRLFNCQVDTFDARDKNGYFPLHYAVKNGHQEVVEYICERTQNPDALTYDKDSVLHFPAVQGHTEMMKVLLSRITKKNVQNHDGKTPLHNAISHKNTEIALLLIQDPDVKVSLSDELDNTPLHLAAISGELEVIKALIRRDNVDIYAEDFQKNCALHVAVKNGQAETFEFLVDLYKSIPVDENLRTPLHLAAKCGHLRIVKKIVNNLDPQNMTPKDRWRNTPLHYAAEEGHLEVVKVLINRAKEKMPLNNSGYCPLDLARTYDKKQVAKYLKSYLGEERVKIFDNRFKRPKEVQGYKQF